MSPYNRGSVSKSMMPRKPLHTFRHLSLGRGAKTRFPRICPMIEPTLLPQQLCTFRIAESLGNSYFSSCRPSPPPRCDADDECGTTLLPCRIRNQARCHLLPAAGFFFARLDVAPAPHPDCQVELQSQSDPPSGERLIAGTHAVFFSPTARRWPRNGRIRESPSFETAA